MGVREVWGNKSNSALGSQVPWSNGIWKRENLILTCQTAPESPVASCPLHDSEAGEDWLLQWRFLKGGVRGGACVWFCVCAHMGRPLREGGFWVYLFTWVRPLPYISSSSQLPLTLKRGLLRSLFIKRHPSGWHYVDIHGVSRTRTGCNRSYVNNSEHLARKV